MKKTKDNKEEDIVTKFWQKYYDSDLLEREEMISKLPVIKERLCFIGIPQNKKVTNALRHSLILMIMSYFDDLINFMEYKNEKQKESRKNSKTKT